MMFVSLGTVQAQTTYETITLPSGAKYVGEVEDGKPNGLGTFTMPDGSKYVGAFKYGKFNGQGL